MGRILGNHPPQHHSCRQDLIRENCPQCFHRQQTSHRVVIETLRALLYALRSALGSTPQRRSGTATSLPNVMDVIESVKRSWHI